MSKINSNSTLFLIDGSTFIFRAYFAMYKASQSRGSGFTRSDGTPTGAVMAFCNMMWKIITNGIDGIHPSHIAVIFDTKEKTFRSDIYTPYKANRDAPPEDLIPQFPLIHKAVEAFNIKCVSQIGYEADDLIATYSKIASERDAKTIIISGDKDLMQLINKNVRMYDPMPGKERFIDTNGVRDKFGVTPDKVVDVQALAGDSTDNIPGVPGIGIKIASELINEYHSLENLLSNAGNIKQNKRRENLINHADDARISYRLALLESSSPIEIDIDDLYNQQLDYDKIISFSKEMELSNLSNRINNWFSKEGSENIISNNTTLTNITPISSNDVSIGSKKQGKDSVIEIHSVNLLEELANEIASSEAFCIDLETNDREIKEVSISTGMQTYYLSDDKNKDGRPSILDLIEKINPFMADETVKKIFFDLKNILPILHSYKITVKSFDDVSLMSYVINNGKLKNDLNTLTIAYKEQIKTQIGIGSDEIGSDQKINISCSDRASIIFDLWEYLRFYLLDFDLIQMYELVEKPLISVLCEIEKNGIKADRSILSELSEEFGQKIKKIEQNIYSLAGSEFNIASPKQLGEILFESLGLSGGKKTKSGTWATGIDILEDLSAIGHTIADEIIEWRQLNKLKTTYTDSLPNFIDQSSGRVHTKFSQALTSTGRLSSSHPNLQNIPIRTSEGKLIRSAFIAEKGRTFLSADYSQIELRVLSHVANIQQLQNAFLDGLDIHQMTASTIFATPLNEVTEKMRYSAKAINFGIIYGISAFGLSKQLKIQRKDAQQFISDYFSRFPGIREYMDSTIEFARTNEHVKTIFGRRCYFPDINSKNHPIRSFNERAAINAPIQGAAADIIKRAMVRISKTMTEKGVKSKMILQIHDELVFEVPDDEIEEMKNIVISNMESATLPLINFKVPLKVDTKISNSWDCA